MTHYPGSLARDAAAPLLIIALIIAAAAVAFDVWLAAGIASLVGSGSWAPPQLQLTLGLELARFGADAILSPDSSLPSFVSSLLTLLCAQTGIAGVGIVLFLRTQSGEARRRLLRRTQLGDLSGRRADRKARELRPSLSADRELSASDRGLRLLRINGRDVWMSWEDVALVIMGPRANKTSALAVPSVLSAPGLAVATSNKADLWALTHGMRAAAGPVWTFDPQQITFSPQTWWWDPLRSIREAPEAGRVEAAARLAGHFMATIGGTRRDPFFHAAGEQVLVGTLLAAAVSGGTLRDVLEWLQQGRRDAITMLDRAGAGIEAADLEASLGGAEVTTKGIFQTARTAVKALTSERILRWVTPPITWREPGGPDVTELDPWDVLAHAERGPATLHLLSKDGAGTAAPVVAALVDRTFEVAELLAQARGGRMDPPVVAVLDEAANICPIKQLPQLYSHYGSRGLQVITMLQNYQQGVGVWGAQGMDTLWSAATIKIVGAGVDDHTFLQKLSGLIGDYDAEKVSVSYGRGRGASRQFSTARQPILPPSALRALPKTQAVVLATGRPAGLGELRPWYRERDNPEIEAYLDSALAELRSAAVEALGPDNPVIAQPRGAGRQPRPDAPGRRTGSHSVTDPDTVGVTA